ncbi:MAG: DUF4270 family protein [Saprospirales bacterium]|nr:DUF4270 family protein [Saprospirales bacterium]
MKSLLFRWGLFAALGVLLNSCTQPGIIGSDLLKGDQIGVSFTDTLPFIAYVQLTDSVKTYGSDLGEQLNSYLCGQFADPVFGLSSAVINAQLVLNSGNPPNFEGATLDSMVLILPYVASRVYGDTTEAYQLEVYLLDEDMLDTANYYSNKTFAATQLIGSTTIFPSPSDSLEILIHGSDTMGTQLVVPQVRIRMDDAFAQSILTEDTLVLESDTSFLEKYKGIQIRGASQNKGMLSFNLNSSLAGLTVYYHVDTIFSQYSFKYTSTSVRMVSFSQDYSSAPANAFLQDSTLCDSLLFVQGTSGLGMVLEFPDISLLENKLINRAELEFTVITLPEDMGYAFDPVSQLIVSEIKDDGTLAIIPDVSVGLARQDLPFLFGGNIDEEGMPQTYKMNLSAYFIDLKNGDAGNRILITPLTRAELANRVVLCGPKHPDYPAKIKLSLTDY